MAATLGNYYIDGPTLSTATTVYTDSELTICAADGFYSDGTVCRQQIGCVLTVAIPCPGCFAPCDSTINETGGQGVYQLTFSTGGELGAMIIYFNPVSVPDGCKAVFDSVTYNEFTCDLFGYLASPNANNHTVLGNASNDCSPPIGTTLDSGGYSGLNRYVYNNATSSFDLIDTNAIAIGTSADVKLTAGDPGWCTLVIPRANQNAGDCQIDIVGYCATSWELEINCPVALPAVPASLSGDDCTVTSFPNFIYHAPNRGNTAGEPSVNEFVFADPNALNKLPAGTYVMNPPSGKKIFTVDANGIITNITVCP